jgi:hypothetical protein
MREVVLAGSPEELRNLAKFLMASADNIEDMGELFSHEHFIDFDHDLKRGVCDFIVAKGDLNSVVQLYDWSPRCYAIRAIQTVGDRTTLGLADSKKVIDDVLGDVVRNVVLDDGYSAIGLVEDLEECGFKSRIVSN